MNFWNTIAVNYKCTLSIGCPISSLVSWLVSVVCLAPELAVVNSALPLEGEYVSSLDISLFNGDCRTLDTEAFV